MLRTQGKNQLLVAATDLDVSLTAELTSHNASDGGIAVLAKSLFERVANAPGDEVTLKKTVSSRRCVDLASPCIVYDAMAYRNFS